MPRGVTLKRGVYARGTQPSPGAILSRRDVCKSRTKFLRSAAATRRAYGGRARGEKDERADTGVYGEGGGGGCDGAIAVGGRAREAYYVSRKAREREEQRTYGETLGKF